MYGLNSEVDGVATSTSEIDCRCAVRSRFGVQNAVGQGPYLNIAPN